MSQGSPWLSVNQATIKRESCRKSNRDFLIDAYNILCKNKSNASQLSRYYHLRINSLVDTDRDDLNYISKISANNTKCTKCGNLKQLRIKRRRRANKSAARRYCRYLRSLNEEYCDKCQDKTVHQLKGKKAIQVKSRQAEKFESITDKIVKQQEQVQAVAKKKKNKEEKAKQPPPKPAPITKPVFSKRLRLAASKPAAPKPLPSSRLRAFTCLLKE